MNPNTHPTTGIAFGIIAAQRLDDDIVEQLLYGQHAVNVSYEAAKTAYVAGKQFDFESEQAEGLHEGEEFDLNGAVDEFAEKHQGDEDTIEGTYQDVKYTSSWIGGAPHFYIFESFMIGPFKPCSPCCPGAGDLHSPDPDGINTYDVPDTWRIT